MIKDPVCDREVDMSSNRYRSVFDGNEYWFESKECKDLFDADPAIYIERMDESEAGRKVADIGKKAAEKSKDRARSMFSERKGDAADIAESVSNALHDASRNLREKNYNETASYMEGAADRFGRFSGHFRDHDVEEIVSEAEDFVRDRPALAIGGALAAGFFLSRFLKSDMSETRHH